MAFQEIHVRSGHRRGRLFGRIHELLHLCSLLVDLRQMFGAQFLINREFLLRLILLPDVNIIRAEAVMGVGRFGIQAERARTRGMDFSY